MLFTTAATILAVSIAMGRLPGERHQCPQVNRLPIEVFSEPTDELYLVVNMCAGSTGKYVVWCTAISDESLY